MARSRIKCLLALAWSRHRILIQHFAWHPSAWRNCAMRHWRTATSYGMQLGLREQKIDLVNAHCSSFGAAAAASLGIPFVQTLDEPELAPSPEFVAHLRDSDAATTTYACATAAVGEYADLMLGLDPAKIHVIGHGKANAQRGARLTSAHANLFRPCSVDSSRALPAFWPAMPVGGSSGKFPVDGQPQPL